MQECAARRTSHRRRRKLNCTLLLHVLLQVPVAAALLAIVPVVPAVDHVSEMVMEPTLGKWLGIEFEHHHGKDKAE